MKKPIILLFALLSACQPYMTYDEMVEAEKVEVDPKQIKKLNKRIERFEDDAEKANEYFALRGTCVEDRGYFWYCYKSVYDEKRVDRMLNKDLTLDERVKLYRRLRSSCGCADSKVLDQILR